ncbi:MAG: hypothetical protein WCS89_00200 [Candidatus Paceibacterota bacterium]
MKFKTNDKKGFVALIAVVLLATGTLTFSLVAMSSAIAYADSISRRELRIQTQMNAQACLDTVTLMVVKDYFISGNVEVKKFGCTAEILNDFEGNISFNVKANLGEIVVEGNGVLKITDNSVEVVSEGV